MTTASNIIQILNTLNVKRHECRDLTFGDAELFFDTPDGTQIGGGYRSRGNLSVWFKVNGMDLNYTNTTAQEICSAIPLGIVSRNDNEGEW